ncbi:MAG: hypothetical protein E7262_03420 [Lachnospiraceae bacterium]|nr:hypothetical protein [Lachnospiraceae bacterium]
MSEKRVKILMTTMVSIIAIMVVIFVIKDISDREEQVSALTEKKVDKEANAKYDKLEGIISRIDSKKSFVIRDYDGEEYECSSDSDIDVCNEYGDVIKVEKLMVGDVVIAGYDKEYEDLKYIYLKEDITRYEELDKFTLGKNNKYIKIDDKKYRLSDETFVYNGGEVAGIYEIEEKDVLNISISGKDVVSVNIIKGHGYINLINFKDYMGQKLLINDDDAYDIEDDMKIAVPEGENLIIIKTDKLKGSKLIEIKRGETVNIDVSKLKFEKKKEGYVTFEIEPKSARVYINGRMYSNKENILLDYGKYNYNVELTGYDSIVGAFVMDEITKTLKLKLSEKNTPSPTVKATSTPASTDYVTMPPTDSSDATVKPSASSKATVKPSKSSETTVKPTEDIEATQAPAETAGILID